MKESEQPDWKSPFGTAQVLSAIIVILAAVAAAGGLFIPRLYEGLSHLKPAVQGQDVITLISLPVLIAAQLAVRRGSTRATMVWMGLVGYLLYTYAGAAFAYPFNAFFLIYVALCSLCVFALVGGVSHIDVEAVRRSFDGSTPRIPVIIYLALVALALGFGEVGQIIPFLTQGKLPELIRQSGGPTCFVYVLDLGFIVPLSVLGAIWLWRRSAWGYILAGALLIKAATMGSALLSMEWFAVHAGQSTDGLTFLWAFITVGGLALSIWFLGRCRNGSHFPAIKAAPEAGPHGRI